MYTQFVVTTKHSSSVGSFEIYHLKIIAVITLALINICINKKGVQRNVIIGLGGVYTPFGHRCRTPTYTPPLLFVVRGAPRQRKRCVPHLV